MKNYILNKRWKLLCAALAVLTGCAGEHAKNINLVCTGEEITATGSSNAHKSEPESVNVTKTILLKKQNKVVVDGVKIMENDGWKLQSGTEAEKNIYVLKIDSKKEIYEESSIVIMNKRTAYRNSGVNVNKELISASYSFSIHRDGAVNSTEDYSIEIDRISGAFKERSQVVWKDGVTSFVNTVGTCKKAEQKF